MPFFSSFMSMFSLAHHGPVTSVYRPKLRLDISLLIFVVLLQYFEGVYSFGKRASVFSSSAAAVVPFVGILSLFHCSVRKKRRI